MESGSEIKHLSGWFGLSGLFSLFGSFGLFGWFGGGGRRRLFSFHIDYHKIGKIFKDG